MGLPANNPAEIAARYAGIAPHFRAMVAAAAEMARLARADNAGEFGLELRRQADVLLANNEPFLVGMDGIVFAYDAAARGENPAAQNARGAGGRRHPAGARRRDAAGVRAGGADAQRPSGRA